MTKRKEVRYFFDIYITKSAEFPEPESRVYDRGMVFVL